MNPLRAFKRQLLVLVSCGLSACGTFVTYTGNELPDREIATFNCYSRYYFVYLESCTIQAMDGLRPGISGMLANTSKILPGPHWVELAFERYFGGGGGISDVCAFDIDLEAGNTYQVKAHSLAATASRSAQSGPGGFHAATLEIEITRPTGAKETRHIRATCNSSGGSMCRKDADCVPHPDIRCFPQDGFPFGQCRFANTTR